MNAAHILVVDDEKDIRELVKDILLDEGYEVSVAENGEAAQAARRGRRPDLILLDVWMPDVDGITLLKRWQDEGSRDYPVIVMSGHGTIETAVEATRLGAYDFLEKPLSMAKLLLTVRRALEAERLARENVGLKRHGSALSEPLGRSAPLQRLREQVRRVAQHDAWVLITGEPGSGKEVCAHYLHQCSARREGPFVDINVATLTRENAALELFGAEDDGRMRYGLLEQANGGILYLDEVADMDLAIQGRLLAVLESGTFVRTGGVGPVQLDVRVVAATHKDLAQEVQAKRFREDLYYQLNVVPLRVPSLREHIEDIPELLKFYVNFFVTQEGLPYRSFSFAAQNRLRNYGWPGNVRELKNLVQRLLILGAGAEIAPDELDIALGAPALPPAAAKRSTPTKETTIDFDLPLREARERFERAYLEHHLHLTGGSVGRVAKLAGLERTHLYRKLRALGLYVKDSGRGTDEE